MFKTVNEWKDTLQTRIDATELSVPTVVRFADQRSQRSRGLSHVCGRRGRRGRQSLHHIFLVPLKALFVFNSLVKEKRRAHTMARYSGLQKEVLALYRRCLRESRKKPVVSDAHWNGGVAVDLFVKESRKHFEAYARCVKAVIANLPFLL